MTGRVTVVFLAVTAVSCLRPEDPPSAQVEVYLSADIGECGLGAFRIDDTCVEHEPEPGSYNTISYNLAEDRTYELAGCDAGCANCTDEPLDFHTPNEFSDEVFRTGFSFSCGASGLTGID